MTRIAGLVLAGCLFVGADVAGGQSPPDFSGVWRLETEESRLIGGAPGAAFQLTWLVDHRDPGISVVVNVRNEAGSREFAFRCTTDGQQCVNALPSLQEVRRMTARWEGSTLVMSQTAETPHGGFEARDRLSLADGGQRLVFERIVINQAGERTVRQVFRKLGPHPSQRQPPPRLPSVELPEELAALLRDYQRHWHAGNADGLVDLFTSDGFVARRGGWIRGSNGLREALQRTSSDLRLRAVAYALGDGAGYIVGAYGYGEEAATADRGMFILALRREPDRGWRIAADLDGAIRQEAAQR